MNMIYTALLICAAAALAVLFARTHSSHDQLNAPLSFLMHSPVLDEKAPATTAPAAVAAEAFTEDATASAAASAVVSAAASAATSSAAASAPALVLAISASAPALASAVSAPPSSHAKVPIASLRPPVSLARGIVLPRARWETLQRQLVCFAHGRWEHDEDLADMGPRVSAPAGGPFAEPGLHWAWVLDSAARTNRSGTSGGRGGGCAQLPRWTRRSFCSVLRGRGVLLVGDSLNRAMHMTLLDLAQQPPQLPQVRNEERSRRKGVGSLCRGNGVNKPCSGHVICRGSGHTPAPLRYRRSDQLRTDVTALRRIERDNVIEEPWLGYASSGEFEIIILNRGAHAARDDAYLAGWRDALAAVRAAAPRALLIARNTPPGHLNCAYAKAPLASPPPSAGLPYGWESFNRQNALLRRLLSEEFEGVLLLDVATATALRPDMHRLGSRGRDCLHYKDGAGPMDTWARLLLALLQRVEAATAGSG